MTGGAQPDNSPSCGRTRVRGRVLVSLSSPHACRGGRHTTTISWSEPELCDIPCRPTCARWYSLAATMRLDSVRDHGWVGRRADVLDGPAGILDRASDVIAGPGCIGGRNRLGVATPDEEDGHQGVRKRVDRGEIRDPGEPRAVH